MDASLYVFSSTLFINTVELHLSGSPIPGSAFPFG